ncbi:hypothetical protein L1987_65386 [Smallanthus sonchifolius]|uniref:Uncharacterized protein n=1 Tax=Smallanthus sonchifolius TaxID=185202 RepID=A0ACB9BUE3_9ASTR|nr:hypothetical protein L1987_65386 [Smallanthus sonchifolius]
MIQGLNSSAPMGLPQTASRVREPYLGESDPKLGPTVGDTGMDLEEMAQSPPSDSGPIALQELDMSLGGEQVHAKPMHDKAITSSWPMAMHASTTFEHNLTGVVQPIQLQDYLYATEETERLDVNLHVVRIRKELGFVGATLPTPIKSGGSLSEKKSYGPKPRMQIPSLNVSKPGPNKPPGRPKPKVVTGSSTNAQNTHVHVSNPSAFDDTTHTDDSFLELNATLKKFAKRSGVKDYYYSLTKDDMEKVESEMDGTARLMSTCVP